MIILKFMTWNMNEKESSKQNEKDVSIVVSVYTQTISRIGIM
jgi:hypothetical protein